MHRVVDGHFPLQLSCGQRWQADLRVPQGHIQKRRHFPGQPQDAQTVGPVGRNGHLQNRIRQPHNFGKILAQRQILENLHQAHMIRGQSQFVFGQEHPFGDHAPELGRLDFVAAGHGGPRRRKGVKPARRHIRGAAHDPEGGAPGGHFGHLQPVRLGVRFHLQNLAHHHPGKFRGHCLHALDLQARHGQLICQGLGVDVEVHKIRQPIKT